jgi:hypothetical protein
MQIDLLPFVNQAGMERLRRALPRAKAYFDERLPHDPSFGVASNTFRAFRGIKGPSVVYRAWARKTIENPEFLAKGCAANSGEGFETFHSFLSNSLESCWQQETCRLISVAHKYKLVDLFTKHVCRLEIATSAINNSLLAHGHVPLDSRVFSCLDRLLSGILAVDGRAMGQVKTEECYRFYQKVIRLLMHNMGGHNLYFDFFAWNLGGKE